MSTESITHLVPVTGQSGPFAAPLPQQSCCTRFVEFISQGAASFWNNFVNLISRIRSCFCRTTPPSEQSSTPAPLISDRVENLTALSLPPRIEVMDPITTPVPLPSQRSEPTAPISTSPSLPIAVPKPQSVEIPAAEQEVTVAKTIVTQFCDFLAKINTGWKNKIRQEVEAHVPLRDNMTEESLNNTLAEREEMIAEECQRQLPFQRLKSFTLQKSVIYRQGSRLFHCLSPKDQLFMLKKLQSLGLAATFRIFVPEMSDPIQEKITARIDGLKQAALGALTSSQVDQSVVATKKAQMETELVKYWDCKPATHSEAWDQIIKSTLLSEIEILAAQESPLPAHVHFVQEIIGKALYNERLDTYLTSEQGQRIFSGFPLKDQLWIIEHLAVLVGNQDTMRIIPPVCIVLLVNGLPQKTREQLTQSVYASDKSDLFEGLNLKPTLTLQDIQACVLPSLWRL